MRCAAGIPPIQPSAYIPASVTNAGHQAHLACASRSLRLVCNPFIARAVLKASMMTSARPSGASRWMQGTLAGSSGPSSTGAPKLSWRSQPEPLTNLHPVWPAAFNSTPAALESVPSSLLRPSGASRVAVRARASSKDAAQVADSASHKRVVITGVIAMNATC